MSDEPVLTAEYVLPEGMTAEKLRAIAHWLDLHDQLAVEFLTLMEKSPVVGGLATAAKADVRPTEVQDDLRRWAALIDGRSDA